ncbi:MAG: DMT family transporter [Gemmatimonadetes bacterium]|nr:DMT family transporter [Gemmatimonadota bacterium]
MIPPGVRFMLAGALSFSIMSLLVKLVGQSLPSQEIVLVRGVITVTISYSTLRAAGIAVGGDRKGLLAVRGILGFGAVSCYYIGLLRLPLADATVIHYTSPVFTAVLAALFLSEPIRGRDAAGLAGALLGVVLLARPTFLFGSAASSLDPVGVAVAFAGAVIGAFSYVSVRELRHSEHHLVIVLWFGVMSTLGAIPGAALDLRLPTPRLWVGLLGIGVTTHLAQIWMTRGLSLVPAGRAMTVGYVQIVFAAVWGALFFGERPTAWTVVGAALVIVSALSVARAESPRPTVGRAVTQ